MKKHKFEISIEAASEQDAISKLKGATVLMQKLSATEIQKLADVVKNDPAKTAMAKKALGL